MLQIRIGDKIYKASRGERLSQVLRRNGLYIEQPCGGKGTCGKCKVLVNANWEKACQYVMESDITVELPKAGQMESVLGAKVQDEVTKNMALALDIGTTTLAMALISLDKGHIVAVSSRTNPQVMYGADVITRIEYCTKYSVKDLQSCLIQAVNEMSGELLELLSEKDVDVCQMYVAGNATMLHIFLGVDPSSMGAAPYKPAFLEGQMVSGENLKLGYVKEVVALPSISAFVGADLVAGLHYVGMPSRGSYSLLVDLGTNAEIVLFSEEKVLCTSAAAGPCFEGANISCGMSATEGAVAEFAVEDGATEERAPSGRRYKFTTIGHGEPKGICGTGLIDIIAGLVRLGIVDRTGYMECERFHIADNVYVNQQDVRQFQLAKSAVYSAIVTLMRVQQVAFEQIERVYIAGGFSAQINVEHAVAVGLLPKELQEKCVVINNSSLLGSIRFACGEKKLEQYLETAEYVDLSMNTDFSELFIENMDIRM